MLRFKLLAAIASCAVLFSAAAAADDHGRGHGDGRNWNNRGDWHQSDGHWTGNGGHWNGNYWGNNGYRGNWNNVRYVPRPVYVAQRPYWGGYGYPGGYYYPAPPMYYGPPVAPVYPYYPYYGGYNHPSVTGSIIFTFPFHF